MEIIGLDTIGIIFVMVAVATAIGFILTFGITIQFTKRQMIFISLFLLIAGMWTEAWLRETDDEFLLGAVMVILAFSLVFWGILKRRRRNAWKRNKS